MLSWSAPMLPAANAPRCTTTCEPNKIGSLVPFPHVGLSSSLGSLSCTVHSDILAKPRWLRRHDGDSTVMSDAGACERHYSRGNDEAIGEGPKGRIRDMRRWGRTGSAHRQVSPRQPALLQHSHDMMHFSRLRIMYEWTLPGAMISAQNNSVTVNGISGNEVDNSS